MKRLVLALQFLTSLPLPSVKADAVDFAASMRWFPVAGLAIGGAVAGAAWIGMRIDLWLGALLALIAWVAITGALHLDGLGDIADAAGAAHGDRDRLSEVLEDPHIGSFGVVAIGLQLMTKFVLLRLTLEDIPLWILLVIASLARIGPLVWTLFLPPLHEGLGSKFRSEIAWPHVTVWMLVASIVVWFAPPLGVCFGLFALWGLWIRRKIGGISGDGHGAGIELVESGLLLAMIGLS
ncbi:MAG: adenosylcobinamide-GDP ribazoletransferase [Parasphingorhabdus sp.]|uniref:adenosylcobinamide-GDP ribazoletransferase n=1 Tax=Parasphingorhabdus sp. TaxID=2709688 RepID=UPI003001F6DC